MNYSRKFTVTEKDVASGMPSLNSTLATNTSKVAFVLDGFDPEQDEQDRRLLMHVAGLRLFQNEFQSEQSLSASSSSDSSGIGSPNQNRSSVNISQRAS